MELITHLNSIIDKWHLLKHTFYQAWSQGHLTQSQLQRYASQYYHQVKSFPRFISRVHTHCPEISARKILLKNLTDEEIHGTDHPALWMQFAEGLGLTKESVLNDEPACLTQQMVDTYYELAESDWREGLCALYAYELQVPAVSASKVEGLKKFYQIDDEATLAFFNAHQVYDVEHANEVALLINQYVDKKTAEFAVEKAAKSLWRFLDGMCEEAGICC